MDQHPYISNTEADRAAMLARIGVPDSAALFADIPAAALDPPIDLPPSLSEPELLAEMAALAERNAHGGQMLSFLGGGAERHFIPSVVPYVLSRSEFATAYTPYQPEISQGTLQTAFEFQTMTCELLDLDVANTGMYDGATAFAEACLMACAVTGRRHIAVTDSVHPRYVETVRTYAFGRDLVVDLIDAQHPTVTDQHACLASQQPGFLGNLQDMERLERLAHSAGALF
ncbi:MAG TPA: glycine dehydrogenase, partial [Dehalococcoidia bacterium]|nr:glycine dehydrogenase [Dehalococcoidia bacterium]